MPIIPRESPCTSFLPQVHFFLPPSLLTSPPLPWSSVPGPPLFGRCSRSEKFFVALFRRRCPSSPLEWAPFFASEQGTDVTARLGQPLCLADSRGLAAESPDSVVLQRVRLYSDSCVLISRRAQHPHSLVLLARYPTTVRTPPLFDGPGVIDNMDRPDFHSRNLRTRLPFSACVPPNPRLHFKPVIYGGSQKDFSQSFPGFVPLHCPAAMRIR